MSKKKEKTLIKKITALLKGLTIDEARNLLMDCESEILKKQVIS